ncbi:hypothetical protein PSTT_16800 [Puccinia striiformis]|uniref:Hydrophobin n=1 Tax=Puccinia striiformis TaxID=27350 RepID=A0A2S4UBH5_9BASI|nr:hypothetical protein PSTT_16800 [Puccinia striiformis]
MFSIRILGAFVVTFCLMGTIMASVSNKQITAGCYHKINDVPADVQVCQNVNTYYDLPGGNVLGCYNMDKIVCCIHRADVCAASPSFHKISSTSTFFC